MTTRTIRLTKMNLSGIGHYLVVEDLRALDRFGIIVVVGSFGRHGERSESKMHNKRDRECIRWQVLVSCGNCENGERTTPLSSKDALSLCVCVCVFPIIDMSISKTKKLASVELGSPRL